MFRIRSLRNLGLPILKRLDRDITIKHPYTGDNVRLSLYKHKGYWYYGADRERETMELFQRIVTPGWNVVEVGGHIGFVALYFSRLVGDSGSVCVFEPGYNNLPYIVANTAGMANITVRREAVSDFVGHSQFYIEELTGQNNSLNPEYSVFQNNAKYAHSAEVYHMVDVDVVTLDAFVAKQDIDVQFIKIDVEGSEAEVLRGAESLFLSQHPICMVEVTDRHQEVFKILKAHGYSIFTPRLAQVETAESLMGNVFCFHRDHHRQQCEKLGLHGA